jgi:carbonic anhydrase/acetyltransferase-like protein (isoleucine patch superfamily)
MTGPYFVPYKGSLPIIGARADISADASLIGQVTLGEDVALGPFATLRADGHRNDIGDGCRFLDRATVHVADGLLPAIVGQRVTVGRFALVHACTIENDCLLCDGAVVMDGSHVGAGAVIAAGALVPPGKTLEGGMLYAGNPAKPVREISPPEREALRDAVLAGRRDEDFLACDLPPLNMAPFRAGTAGAGPLFSLANAAPEIDPETYVAPNAVVAGDVTVAGQASIWFATVMRAEGAPIRVGARSNIQDNSILLASTDTGPMVIGEDVTVGHNVRMAACTVGDDCLIGMGSEVMPGVVVEDGAMIGARAFVEPGTVVKAGYIWAGRPAREFRPVKPEEQFFFGRGKEVYVGYAGTYLAEAAW